MLQFIRDRAQGWIAWVIVGLIIIPFALWGVNQYTGGGSEPVAVSVNDSDITQRELQNAYYRQLQRLKQMFGDKLPPNLFSEEALKKQVQEQLIEERLVYSAAVDSKMGAGDNLVIDTIRSVDAFKEDGKFSKEAYERALRMQGMMPGGFEEKLRRDIMIQQYRQGVEVSDFTSKNEKISAQRLINQTRDMGFVVVPAANFTKSVSVSDEEIKSYYEQNQSRYMQPEMVSVKYIELDGEKLAKAIDVDDQQIKERYESQLINYRTPEERNARHILIEVGDDASDDEVNTAKSKIETIRNQLIDGADFAALAKKESNDPGSAAEGGSLGFFGKGVMDKAFEEAAFNLKVGELSQVVRSQFGFHLIKLDEVRGGTTKGFDEVKDDIKKEIQNEIADQRLYDLADRLANNTYEHPESLEVASTELKLPIKISPLFSRSGGTSGITKEQKLVDFAFSEEVLNKGNNSEVIELSSKHMVVIRLNERQPERIKPLEEVKGVIMASIQRTKGEEKAGVVADELLSKITAGNDPSKAAKAISLEWKDMSGVKRTEQGVDRQIIKALFKMPKPESGVTYRSESLPSGDYVVIKLSKVTDGTGEEEGAKENSYARASLNAVLGQLREQSSIVYKNN